MNVIVTAKRSLIPEDVLDFKSVEEAQISPDGSQVAFGVAEGNVSQREKEPYFDLIPTQ